MLPEAVVEKTLENSANFCLNIEAKNREDPRKHYKYCSPGLQYPRQKEMVATDAFFPTSTIWDVYPLKTESHNVSALQDYFRDMGIPSVLKSDNAQSETGSKWTDFCHHQCIKEETTEQQSP
eukprot:15038580-Ditylum_brightwellii.AAC.3